MPAAADELVRSETARTSLGGLGPVTTPRRHQPPWSVQLGQRTERPFAARRVTSHMPFTWMNNS
jgi:hypothetical protein